MIHNDSSSILISHCAPMISMQWKTDYVMLDKNKTIYTVNFAIWVGYFYVQTTVRNETCV